MRRFRPTQLFPRCKRFLMNQLDSLFDAPRFPVYVRREFTILNASNTRGACIEWEVDTVELANKPWIP